MKTINKKKTVRTATAKDSRKAGDVLNKKTENKKTSDKKSAVKKAKPFLERVTAAAGFILEQKFTDEEIIAKVDAKFPDYSGSPAKYSQREMGRARWMLRNDKLTTRKLEKDQPFGRLFKTEDGKLVERSELPKKARAAKKVKKEDDPLNNIADIDVHGKKEKTPAAKKTKVNKAEELKKKIKKSKTKK